MTNQEKVDLINTLHEKVVDFHADGEFCHFVEVPFDNQVLEILQKLGFTEDDINSEKYFDDYGYYLDLTAFGFNFANWWDEEEGFLLKD